MHGDIYVLNIVFYIFTCAAVLTGLWTGKESCADGLHNCWISGKSHTRVFGGMEHRKF